ncbi:MAG: oligoendopeptidase F [Anaerolineae bacterium]|nr:oligoendopeptidase F [Anaerolineae bacterium]
MTCVNVRKRSEIADRYKWNAPSVFESPEAWEEAFAALATDLPQMQAFKGRLGESPEVLAGALALFEDIFHRVGQLHVYAIMSHSVDMNDQAAMGRLGKAQGLFGQARAASAFLDPELLEAGEPTLRHWVKTEPRLSFMEQYIDNLFRTQAHTRSTEVEEVLELASDPFSGPQTIAGMLTNADFKFPPARAEEGAKLPVTQGSLQKILAGADREARRTAWENYMDTYLAFKNTLAASLTTSIKQNVFQMRVHRHESTLSQALFTHNIPVEVFHNLIDTFRENLPTWRRYWALRRKALNVETLHPYDVWAPLTANPPEAVPFEQAIAWICEGLAPMGETYVETVRKGALEQRWIDVYPNEGKRAGAFSTGWPGTYPFIMTSFNDNLLSLSTLAHELGHSMHSYLTWENQPFIYSQYSLFVAEVASNFHQALVRNHLLSTRDDPAFQIAVIEEAMSNFHRYFFIMPTLARFEFETHRRIEQGRALNADTMNALMADLFEEGYGGEVHVDRDRVGITWATFGHLYVDYYVYQYATGISGAHALAQGVLAGAPNAVENYLSFLKTGSARYPLDALRLAGVDLTSPEPVQVTFDTLAEMVDRLEMLLN